MGETKGFRFSQADGVDDRTLTIDEFCEKVSKKWKASSTFTFVDIHVENVKGNASVVKSRAYLKDDYLNNVIIFACRGNKIFFRSIPFIILTEGMPL